MATGTINPQFQLKKDTMQITTNSSGSANLHTTRKIICARSITSSQDYQVIPGLDADGNAYASVVSWGGLSPANSKTLNIEYYYFE